MPTYRTTIPTTSEYRSWIEAVRGLTHIVNMDDHEYTVEIDAEDEWELYETVRELREALICLTMETVDIPRPAEVQPE